MTGAAPPDRSTSPQKLQDRVSQLEDRLAASRRTIAVLMDRVERPPIHAGIDRFALYKTIAGLQDQVRHRSQQLERSEAWYRALYEQSPDAILTVDHSCRVSDCNSRAELLFGRPREQVQGAPIAALLDPASGAALATILQSGFVGVGESDVALADGRRLSFSVARLEEVGWLLVLRDVTRNHELDQEMGDARRLAGVGRLAASIAHEVNSPLSVIQARLDVLDAQEEVDEETLRRQVKVLKEHSHRISGLVRNLQTFAIYRRPRRKWMRVTGICDDARQRMLGRLRRRSVVERIEPRDLKIRVDEEFAVQLFCGLLQHAVDNSPADSEIVVAARREGDEVRISVHREGRSLPEDLMARLRSPYSGRHVDPALGLNLAIAWAVAQDHDGWLTAEERGGGGASYHVSIPDFAPGERQERPPVDSLRILVVDDDQLLCEAVVWMLERDGHRIQTASDAQEAFECMRRERFDVVLVDYLLPGDIDGEELLLRLEEDWPDIAGRTILTSGLLHTPKHSARYLQKPFNRAQLRELIQELTG